MSNQKPKPRYVYPRTFCNDNIFIKPDWASRFDYTWGFIQHYTWYKDENIHRIEELIKLLPREKDFLETIIRRIKSIDVIREELKALQERYNWNKLPGIYDFYLSRFEQAICQFSELIMYAIQFYIRNKQSYKGQQVERFEDIGEFLIDSNNGLPNHYHKAINDTALLSILLFIRNSLVHDFKDLRYVQNGQSPIIESNNIPPRKRYGVMRTLYPDYLLNIYYRGRKKPQSFIKLSDPRFYLIIELWLTKKCTVGYDKTRISFSTKTYELVDRLIKKEFWGVIRDLLSILVSENKKPKAKTKK